MFLFHLWSKNHGINTGIPGYSWRLLAWAFESLFRNEWERWGDEKRTAQFEQHRVTRLILLKKRLSINKRKDIIFLEIGVWFQKKIVFVVLLQTRFIGRADDDGTTREYFRIEREPSFRHICLPSKTQPFCIVNCWVCPQNLKTRLEGINENCYWTKRTP